MKMVRLERRVACYLYENTCKHIHALSMGQPTTRAASRAPAEPSVARRTRLSGGGDHHQGVHEQ